MKYDVLSAKPGVSMLRRRLALSLISMPFAQSAVAKQVAVKRRADIRTHGARGDGAFINTAAIQSAIDAMAAEGGGTVVVPKGVFVSGALFMKPSVHLHLQAGAVLRCTTDMKHFPRRRTRIEGHFEDHFTPAFINADGCDGLRVTGQGTLDGAGRPIWDKFWALRKAAPDPANFPNLSVDRARLMLIENSRDVTIEGIRFKDSQFWNLHLYRCQGVSIRGASFVVPDDYKQAPSSDAIDIDSSQNVTVENCFFSVTDDCIAAKGSKGPYAMSDRDSPPVENIRIRNCHFARGHQAFTCGSEATIVRNVVMENCSVSGAMNLIMLKLRPDTPQHYEDIEVRDIQLDSDGGRILLVEPWSQFRDLKGAAPPHSVVRNIRLRRISGKFGSFGIIRPNPGQTDIGEIHVRQVALTLDQEAELTVTGDATVLFEDVVINGQSVKGPARKEAPVAPGGYRLSG